MSFRLWTVVILLVFTLQSCADEDCIPPATWNEAWYLDGCEDTDEGTVCTYRDQTCHYFILQPTGSCEWVKQEFGC